MSSAVASTSASGSASRWQPIGSARKRSRSPNARHSSPPPRSSTYASGSRHQPPHSPPSASSRYDRRLSDSYRRSPEYSTRSERERSRERDSGDRYGSASRSNGDSYSHRYTEPSRSRYVSDRERDRDRLGLSRRSRSPETSRSSASRPNGSSSRRSRSPSPVRRSNDTPSSSSSSATPRASRPAAPPPPPFFYKAIGKADFRVMYSPDIKTKSKDPKRGKEVIYRYDGEGVDGKPQDPRDKRSPTWQKAAKKMEDRASAPLHVISWQWDKDSTGPPPPSPPCAILVTGYPGSTSSGSIRDFFTTFGRIETQEMKVDSATGGSLGICRIVFVDDIIRVGDSEETIKEKAARAKKQTRPKQDGHTVALTSVLKGDGQKIGSAMLYAPGGVKVEMDGDGALCKQAVKSEQDRRRASQPATGGRNHASPDARTQAVAVSRPPPPPPPSTVHPTPPPPPPRQSPVGLSPVMNGHTLPISPSFVHRNSPSAARAPLPPPFAPSGSAPRPDSAFPARSHPFVSPHNISVDSASSRPPARPMESASSRQAATSQPAPATLSSSAPPPARGPPRRSSSVQAAVAEAIVTAQERLAQNQAKANGEADMDIDSDAENGRVVEASSGAVPNEEITSVEVEPPDVTAVEPPKKTSGWTEAELIHEAHEIIIDELVSAFGKDVRNRLISAKVKEQLALVDAGGRATSTARAAAAAAAAEQASVPEIPSTKEPTSLPTFSRRKNSTSSSRPAKPATKGRGRRGSTVKSEAAASSDDDISVPRSKTLARKETPQEAVQVAAEDEELDEPRHEILQPKPTRARRDKRRPSHIAAEYTSEEGEEEDAKPPREDVAAPTSEPVPAPLPAPAEKAQSAQPQSQAVKPARKQPKPAAAPSASAQSKPKRPVIAPPPLSPASGKLSARRTKLESQAGACGANAMAAESLHFFDLPASAYRPRIRPHDMRTGPAPRADDEPQWYKPVPMQFGEPVHVGRNLAFGGDLSTAHFVSSMTRLRSPHELYGYLTVLPPRLDPRCIDASKIDPAMDPELAMQKEEYRIHRRLQQRESKLERVRHALQAAEYADQLHDARLTLQAIEDEPEEDDDTFDAIWEAKLSRALDRRAAKAEAESRIPRETPDPIDLGLVADEEDMYYVKLALERLKAGQDMHPDLPPYEDENAPPSSHPSGSARTEGYYKITLAEKMASRPMANRTTAAVDDVAAATATGKAVSRLARATNRGVVRDMEMTKKVAATDTDVLKFNQLRTRKKQLTFARSGIEGYGLFAKEFIPAGDMVIEYVGELIRQQVADRREKAYERQGIGSSYLFRVDEDLVVDATKKGNLGRLINHCCVPNCTARIITINNSKKIVIYAKADIAPGEEVTYDYHFAHEEVKIPCLCGHPLCRKYLN